LRDRTAESIAPSAVHEISESVTLSTALFPVALLYIEQYKSINIRPIESAGITEGMQGISPALLIVICCTVTALLVQSNP